MTTGRTPPPGLGDDGLRERVRQFWARDPCAEVCATGGSLRDQLEAHAGIRYELEPFLPRFARFQEGKDIDVLEIGVGMGADHLEWARSSPRSLIGVDLTARAPTPGSRCLSSSRAPRS